MVYSKFNIYNHQEEFTWVFNTLTLAFCKLRTQDMAQPFETMNKSLCTQLKRMGIIVDDCANEINQYKFRYFSSAFNSQNLFLTIAPVMTCNFSCQYCFEGVNKTMSKMSDAVAQKIVDFIASKTNKNIQICWFGGEPLLAFDKIIQISQDLLGRGVEFSATMITNGSLLDIEKAKQLEKNCVKSIQITIDGLKHIHDKRRYFKSGRGSFDVIIENIRSVIENTNVQLLIEVNVDHSNSGAYEDVKEYFMQNFESAISNGRIRIGRNFVLDRTGFDSCGNCFSTYERMLEKLTNRDTSKLGLPYTAVPCMYRNPMSYAIDPKGNLYKCLEFLEREEFSIGNVMAGTMSFSKLSNSVFECSPFDDKHCLNCPVLPICGGGCPKDRLNRKDDNDFSYCSSYKNHLSEILPMYSEKYH